MPFLSFLLDQTLQQRRDQLNAQVLALGNLQSGCDNVPSSSWVDWQNDFNNWQSFYSAESNWVTSSDSKAALDAWQTKFQAWSNQFASYGCGGSLGSVDGITVVSSVGNTDNGIPSIKDPPANAPGFFDTIVADVGKVTGPVTSEIATVGWVAVGVIVLVVIVLGAVLIHGKASGYGVKVGS